ncbi:uncharacterized protein LACBIDRAFT_295230 [Laccaria bicolor S238N-H82]|uniref:Predicted protein n=1 Tax=Laccaria bicolor (strain S238N-H82 / ATCC MYA-4686) TaxID=486041 RepID=B0DPL9_LACBS|nr:uncharacterized protein LACBIDRAFT_295230 [Laccaria bicolor S238N-H82]EDR03398.1 predicted protein [Laccaria bicolor S238N-H82]|eukprot:XP_001885854.1 predicted protein [Laccaria bicolor S238N-H82]
MYAKWHVVQLVYIKIHAPNSSFRGLFTKTSSITEKTIPNDSIPFWDPPNVFVLLVRCIANERGAVAAGPYLWIFLLYYEDLSWLLAGPFIAILNEKLSFLNYKFLVDMETILQELDEIKIKIHYATDLDGWSETGRFVANGTMAIKPAAPADPFTTTDCHVRLFRCYWTHGDRMGNFSGTILLLDRSRCKLTLDLLGPVYLRRSHVLIHPRHAFPSPSSGPIVRNGGDEGDARFVVVLERRGLTRKRLRHHSCPNFKLRQECIKESFLILDVQLTMDYTTHSINFFPPKRHEVVLQGQKVANSSVMSQSLADLVTGNCQAGQRWPSSSILMYLAEYMSTVGEFGGNVQIIPFDESDVSNMDPIIDFVISKGSTYDGDNLFVLPRIICTNKDDMAQHQFCAIFQTTKGNLYNISIDDLYASTLAPFCRRSVGFKALRGELLLLNWTIMRLKNHKPQKSKKKRRKRSREQHSTQGSDSQIQIDGQSAEVNEAERSSCNNAGTELGVEPPQEKEIKEKEQR